MVSIKDVAEACGVSPMTVTRAFKKDSVIAEKTRNRILKVANELGYIPSILPSVLLNSRTNAIGVIIPSLENYTYIEFLRKIEEKVSAYGYYTLVRFVTPREEEYVSALEMMGSNRVSAIVMLNMPEYCKDIVEKLNVNIPVIVLSHYSARGVARIEFDDQKGIYNATQHLLSNGHRKIAYFGYGPSAKENIKGYYTALAEHGIVPCEDIISTEWIEDDECFLEKITKEKPTAVIGIARQGEKCLSALYRGGFRIPQDISFLAYDDSSLARTLGIDVISHPMDDFANLIMEFINNNVSAEQRIATNYKLDVILTKRHSVKKIL